VGKGGENARGRLHGYFKEALDTMVQIEWLEIKHQHRYATIAEAGALSWNPKLRSQHGHHMRGVRSPDIPGSF
jgi:hypothetical protein